MNFKENKEAYIEFREEKEGSAIITLISKNLKSLYKQMLDEKKEDIFKNKKK